MKKYKLTTQNLTTYNEFQWEIGKEVTTSGEGELCGRGWLHYYHSPLLAVLLNPIHADIANPKLFEVEAEGAHLDDRGLKGGCTRMTLIKEVELPVITSNQIQAFAILVAKQVYKDKDWNTWADKWLSGEDRSEAAARAAVEVAEAAARTAVWVAGAAAWAAKTAVGVVGTAAGAAAWAAVRAVWAVAEASIDLQAVAKQAMKY